MDQVQPILDQALGIAREGFGQVNAILGLLIALVAAFLMSSYRSILVITAGATIAHILIRRLIPLVSGSSAFQLPPLLEGWWWRSAGVLFVGFFIVISVLYILRRAVLKR